MGRPITPSAKIVYAYLADQIRQHGQCTTGIRLLGDVLGLKHDAVGDAIRNLERVGAIAVDWGGDGRRNTYHLGPRAQALEAEWPAELRRRQETRNPKSARKNRTVGQAESDRGIRTEAPGKAEDGARENPTEAPGKAGHVSETQIHRTDHAAQDTAQRPSDTKATHKLFGPQTPMVEPASARPEPEPNFADVVDAETMNLLVAMRGPANFSSDDLHFVGQMLVDYGTKTVQAALRESIDAGGRAPKGLKYLRTVADRFSHGRPKPWEHPPKKPDAIAARREARRIMGRAAS